MMDKATAEKVVKLITSNMERESSLLYPMPDTIIHDAFGILKLIQEEAGLPDSTVDHWMLVAQARAPEHNKEGCIFCQPGYVITDIKVEIE